MVEYDVCYRYLYMPRTMKTLTSYENITLYYIFEITCYFKHVAIYPNSWYNKP